MTALRIDGEMTIYRAGELKQTLLDELALAGQGALDIDLAGVTEIDTAGVQLLMLAKKTAGERQCELRLGGHSEAVTQVFELLNLATYFGDPLVVAAAPSRPQAARASHES